MDDMQEFEDDFQAGRSWEDKMAELLLASRISAAQELGGQA